MNESLKFQELPTQVRAWLVAHQMIMGAVMAMPSALNVSNKDRADAEKDSQTLARYIADIPAPPEAP